MISEFAVVLGARREDDGSVAGTLVVPNAEGSDDPRDEWVEWGAVLGRPDADGAVRQIRVTLGSRFTEDMSSEYGEDAQDAIDAELDLCETVLRLSPELGAVLNLAEVDVVSFA